MKIQKACQTHIQKPFVLPTPVKFLHTIFLVYQVKANVRLKSCCCIATHQFGGTFCQDALQSVLKVEEKAYHHM